MQSRNMAPVAIIFNTVNTILAQGAALGGISMLAGFDQDVTELIPHGSLVEVDPETKTLRLLRGGSGDTAPATFAHGQSETSPVHLKPRH
ncbi:Aconitate hydratase X, predicted [Cupriavidus basilensis]|uniref:Aconitate hydratase X, predicted n=2 Tax=Cupriavidus TaxID=106589 RepID=A0A0C4YLJ8_9BURK|nr:Aconitate hydratase X, predicted [Cupriavidus basilensis]